MYGTGVTGVCLAATAVWAEAGVAPANVSIIANTRAAPITAPNPNQDFFMTIPFQETAIAAEKQCSKYNRPMP
jgi:hypothetical protein